MTMSKCIFNGWKCETIINLETCLNTYNEPSTRILEFITLKGCNGVSTHASVSVMNDKNGNKECIIFQDYSKIIMNFPKVRATEKSIKECHKLASEKFAEHIAVVKIQYKIGA